MLRSSTEVKLMASFLCATEHATRAAAVVANPLSTTTASAPPMSAGILSPSVMRITTKTDPHASFGCHRKIHQTEDAYMRLLKGKMPVLLSRLSCRRGGLGVAWYWRM